MATSIYSAYHRQHHSRYYAGKEYFEDLRSRSHKEQLVLYDYIEKEFEYREEGYWFYNNGKPKEYANYKFNELEGPFIHFFENGNKQYEGNYYRGRRTNDWIYYNSKGRPIFKETYRKGLIVSKQDINKP